jgi:hypothetical protein
MVKILKYERKKKIEKKLLTFIFDNISQYYFMLTKKL